VEPAAVLGQGDARPFDLPGTSPAAQLFGQLEELPESRGRQRVPLGLQPTRRVDRQSSTQRGVAALGRRLGLR
jgi:hypothetical protein